MEKRAKKLVVGVSVGASNHPNMALETARGALVHAILRHYYYAHSRPFLWSDQGVDEEASMWAAMMTLETERMESANAYRMGWEELQAAQSAQ